MAETLIAKIESRRAHVAVIGLGYVGLPLAVDLAKAGFEVTGFDLAENRVNMINDGVSYVEDIPDRDLKEVTAGRSAGSKGGIRATTDFSLLRSMDAVSVCVPTPLGKSRDPDISHVLHVRDRIRENIHPQMLVILESTTYPGTTEELYAPMVSEAGLTLGENFFLCFSPERIDPGNKRFRLKNTPKVIGGMTKACTRAASALYGTAVDTLVCVGSPRAAEMVKLLENTYRAVNIGLVNEVAMMSKVLGVDTWEVIDAAATKPFGFTPFYPGPGLGGHCIPVDPLYLSWKLKSLNYTARFIELADEVNSHMPHHVVTLAAEILNRVRKSLNGSKVLLLGVAYKPDVSDMRESPALDVFRLLGEKGAEVSFNDPYVSSFKLDGSEHCSVETTDAFLSAQDLVVITTHHAAYDWARIVENSRCVLDTRNATKGLDDVKIVRL